MFLVNAVLLFGSLLVLWVIGVAARSVSFIDAVWGFSMAVLAVNTFLMGKPDGLRSILMVMTVSWGVRLGLHLLIRYFRNGEDERYRKLLPDPESFAITALWKVFGLQGVLILLVSSPATVGIFATDGDMALPVWAWPGIVLFVIGMLFEVVGDWQLARFKADPANKGSVMDKGLWRYTRHPNYFGDACVWWGIWLTAMAGAPDAVIWTLPGPLFLTFTLVKWSGAAMTESGMRTKYGDEFADYVRRTSAFIPMPPRNRT